MVKNKVAWVMTSLVAVILLLLGIIIYTLVIMPNLNAKQMQIYNEGVNQGVAGTIDYIVGQINQMGYAQVSIGNQTLVLVPGQFNPQQTGTQTQELQQ